MELSVLACFEDYPVRHFLHNLVLFPSFAFPFYFFFIQRIQRVLLKSFQLHISFDDKPVLD